MAKRNKSIFETTEEKDEIRLNKLLSDAGLCSRRKADELIAQGKVRVNGEIAVTGMKVTKKCSISVSGKPVEADRRLSLIALNKPKGIVCTTDTTEPDNVISFLDYGKRVFPIGRLDKDSEGLLLLTNDGDIVNKILRAGNQHEKEYLVMINQPVTPEFIRKMSEGVPILDTVTKPCTVEMTGKCEFRIILTQGLNRQIRRMCEYFGYKVIGLTRVRIMNISLGRLKTGDFRNVTDREIEELKKLLESSTSEPAVKATEQKSAAGKRLEASGMKTAGKRPEASGMKTAGKRPEASGMKTAGKRSETSGMKTAGKRSETSGMKAVGKRPETSGMKTAGKRSEASGMKAVGKRSETSGMKAVGKRSEASGMKAVGKRSEMTGTEYKSQNRSRTTTAGTGYQSDNQGRTTTAGTGAKGGYKNKRNNTAKTTGTDRAARSGSKSIRTGKPRADQ